MRVPFGTPKEFVDALQMLDRLSFLSGVAQAQGDYDKSDELSKQADQHRQKLIDLHYRALYPQAQPA